MKKRILSVAVMMTMAMSLMPIMQVNAGDVTDTTFTLTGNRTEQIVILSGSTVTLDLAGYNLTVTGKSAIVNKGTLTIKDSVGTGKISASGVGDAAVATLPGSTTTIENGSFTVDSWYVIKNFGTMTINDATVNTTSIVNSALIANGWFGNDSIDKIEGVVYSEKNASADKPATLTINGGTFTGNTTTADNKDSDASKPTSTAVKNDDYGVMTINNGTFSMATAAIANNNKATINGGTFTGKSYAIDDWGNNAGGNITNTIITGGSFTGPISINERGTTDATVSGGTFAGEIVKNQPADSAAAGSTGTLTITAGTFKSADGSKVLDVSKYVPVTSSYDSKTGTVTLKNTSITKYVLYRGIPSNVTFSYTLTMGDTTKKADDVLVTASTNHEEIRNGIMTGAEQPSSVSFTSDDFNNGHLSTELTKGNFTDTESAKMDSDHNYVTKQVNLDFSNVNFGNPGVYRYLLTETSNSKLYPASGALYVDVYVNRMSKVSTDPLYSSLYVQAVITHKTTDSEPATDMTASTNAMTNKTNYLLTTCTMKPVSLTVKYYSLGNQASRTSDFKYRLTLSNVTPGAVINYVRSNTSSDTVNAQKITGTFTVSSEAASAGTATFDFTLEDHEAISFTNMPQDPSYTVSLIDTSVTGVGFTQATKFENYQLANAASTATNAIIDSTDTTKTIATDKADTATSESVSSGSGEDTVYSAGTTIKTTGTLATDISTSYSSVTDTKLTKDTTVVFSVYKNGSIPTGVIVNVAPYAVVVLAGFFGIIVFALKRRNKDEEEA